MDHAELLIQIRRLYQGGQVTRLVINVDIPADELSLDEVDRLERDQKRDRHKIHDCNEPYTDVEEALDDHVRRIVVLVRVKVPIVAALILRPDR